MERLLAAHPDFALAGAAELWLARGELAAGRYTEAARRFAAIERAAPTGDAAREAKKGRADAALAAGRPLEARRLYRALADDSPTGAEMARAGIAAADRALARSALFFGALLYLAAFLALAARTAAGRLARAPFELKVYLPVAALFAAAACARGGAIAVATSSIAAGGALIIWTAAAAGVVRLERAPLHPAARAGHAAAIALAALALFYAALHATGLVDVVVETLRYGPDR
jgi:hypothetical protein